jgi:cytochrome c553
VTPSRLLLLGRRSIAAVLAYACCATAPADAVEPPAIYSVCATCHGADGLSTANGAPSLAGQPDNFLQWQMLFFRLGRRKSEIMEPIAANLKDDEIRALGAFIASLPPPVAERRDTSELLERGRVLVERNRCRFCHGEKLQGAAAAARLAGQQEDYVLKALQDFKASRRIGGGVSSMADALYSVDETDLPALAHFVTGAQD